MRTRRRLLKTVLILLLAGIVIQILFDPLSSLLRLGEGLQARISLPGARRKWEEQGIQHYTFDIQGYVPLVCMFGGNIEVKDGIVVQTGPRSDGQLTTGLTAKNEIPLCNYQIYTMPLLFDELDRWLREAPLSVSEVSFDPSFGFISSFHFGISGGRGMLNPRINDCCGGFSIENFQVLEK